MIWRNLWSKHQYKKRFYPKLKAAETRLDRLR
jgi:hypothetical protein